MMLAVAYESAGRYGDAEQLERDTIERRRRTGPASGPLVGGDLAAVARNLVARSRWSEAVPVWRECLKIKIKETPDGWSPFDAMSLTGAALPGQGLHAEAEALLLGGLEGLEVRWAPVPRCPRRFDCVKRANA